MTGVWLQKSRECKSHAKCEVVNDFERNGRFPVRFQIAHSKQPLSKVPVIEFDLASQMDTKNCLKQE